MTEQSSAKNVSVSNVKFFYKIGSTVWMKQGMFHYNEQRPHYN